MTISSWSIKTNRQLTSAGIETARLDMLVLLEDCLRQDRALLLAHPETKLTSDQIEMLQAQVAQRAAHVPLGYIRGKSEFYGREFAVNHHVLEPRPESENIIDILKDLAPPQDAIVIDIGTGSGALAVTAKCELPHIKVMAADVDQACLDVAGRNAGNHATDVSLLQGDLLDAVPDTARPFALLCNLPYVPDNYKINRAAGYEPRLALFGGADGLGLYRRLFVQAHTRTYCPQHIITESLPIQHAGLKVIAAGAGYVQADERDFIQLFSCSAQLQQ